MILDLWRSPDVQRVLKLLFIIFLGKLLSGRFPGKDPNVVQTLLLQFLVPATLFKGLSKETIEWSHMNFLGAGVVFVVTRLISSTIASYAILGSSQQAERAMLRRTAVIELSTAASALSVLPFITAFLGDEWVGSAAIVDLPMKLYMLVVIPILLKTFCEKSSGPSAAAGGGGGLDAIVKMLKDPITLSLIFGILTSVLTGGQGTKALGFAGSAIEALSLAQTPVLFLLIGMKFSIEGSTPLFCVTLLATMQGIILIMVSLFVLIASPTKEIALFVSFFAQPGTSVIVVGLIKSAIDKGVPGWSSDFAFDIVGIAFPISSLMQCSACIIGSSYPDLAGFVGIVLVIVGVALRVTFKSTFEVPALLNVDPEALPTNGSNTQLANKS